MQNKDTADENLADGNRLYYRTHFLLILENFITIAPGVFFCMQKMVIGKSGKRILVSESHDVLPPHSYSSFSQENWNSHQVYFTASVKTPQ